ncbi:MAG: hypothetical protein LBS55_08280 [Prevotellaceae bacterium]|jgi:hypothetical protein|nr:hypothetical protein [Prevotellaceae bacterium]
MKTDIKTQLERYTELVQKICNYSDKSDKQTAFENILGKINDLIPDVIGRNLHNIQNYYTRFYFPDYSMCRFRDDISKIIRLVNEYFGEICEYKNDSKEKRAERQLKLNQFSQALMAKEIVTKRTIINGIVTHEERELDPDWFYSEAGAYTQYVSLKSRDYFPICLDIKREGYGVKASFETVNRLVLLYIAVNNELKTTNEELDLLGISKKTPQINAGSSELAEKYIAELPNTEKEPAPTPQQTIIPDKIQRKAEPLQPESNGNNKQYTFDPSEITTVYDFCIDTGVLKSDVISLGNFISAVDSANFKDIYEHAKQQKAQCKCKYTIFVLSKFVTGEDWYLNTAHSIDTEPNRCSGINVPLGWKKNADKIK